jgi:broad specificity phosphatase PhoE
LAEHLAEEVIDHIYTSDLKRASQTALPIAKLKKLKLKKTKKLRERNMGIFADKTIEEIKKLIPESIKRFGELSDKEWQKYKGEPTQNLLKRIKLFLNHIKKSHQGETVAIITHGGLKRNILRFLGLESYLGNTSFTNTSITILEKDQNGKYKITTFANTSHL